MLRMIRWIFIAANFGIDLVNIINLQTVRQVVPFLGLLGVCNYWYTTTASHQTIMH